MNKVLPIVAVLVFLVAAGFFWLYQPQEGASSALVAGESDSGKSAAAEPSRDLHGLLSEYDVWDHRSNDHTTVTPAVYEPVEMQVICGPVDVADEAQSAAVRAYVETLMPLLVAYDGSADWHQQFKPFLQSEGWDHSEAGIDSVLGSAQGLSPDRIELHRFIDDKGFVCWEIELHYPSGGVAWLGILDICVREVDGEFVIYWIAPDWC